MTTNSHTLDCECDACKPVTRLWTHPLGLPAIEQALDDHGLYVAVGNGKFWLARRNGATKRWKKDPERFRIPVKFGFKGTGAIDQYTDRALLRVAGSREEAEA